MRLSTHSTPQHDANDSPADRCVAADARQSRSDLGCGVWWRVDARSRSAGHRRRSSSATSTSIGSPAHRDRCTRIAKATSGSGMRGGLIRLSESSFTNVTQLEGLTNEGVRTATVGSDGSVWVATGHGLNRFSPSGRTSYSVSQTMALHSDRRGTMWVCRRRADQPVRERTVRAGRRSRRDSEKPRDGAHDGSARTTLWLCTALKGVMTWDGKAVTTFERQADIADQRVPVDLHRQPRSRVDRAALGAASPCTTRARSDASARRDGLPRGTVLAILEDANGASLVRHVRGRQPHSERPLHVDHAGQRTAEGSGARSHRGSRRVRSGSA